MDTTILIHFFLNYFMLRYADLPSVVAADASEITAAVKLFIR
jgi:hypothetical protein